MHIAELGDRVRIQYFRTLEPETATVKPPLEKAREFIVGSKEVFPALSLGVIGMTPGERKQFTVQPREAYGTVHPNLFRQISRERFPKDMLLRVGKRLTSINSASGRRQKVRIVEILPDSVLVNGNHPLAGKAIELDVLLVSVDKSSDANKRQPQFDVGGES